MPVHSQFVLLAFLIQQSDDVRNFWPNTWVLIQMRDRVGFICTARAPWTSKEGDPRFWRAKGVVASFLDRLYNIALAPVELSRRERVSWSDKVLQFKYLYVKDIASLRKLVGEQRPAEFFVTWKAPTFPS